jgi:excisionase family DNA binding protein
MPNTVTPPILLLRSAEAARTLAVSRRKLWDMTARGEIPHVRIGRCVRYSVDDLRRWIEDQKGGDA